MDTTAWIKSLDFTREPEIASHVYSTRSQRGHGQWWIRGGINPKVVGCSDLGFLTRCHSVPFHPTTFHYIPLYSLYIFNHIYTHYIYTLYMHYITLYDYMHIKKKKNIPCTISPIPKLWCLQKDTSAPTSGMARPGSPPPPVPSRCNGRRQPTMAVLWLGPRRGWQGDDRARHWDVCCKGKNMTRLLECHGFIWIYQWKNRMVCFFRMIFSLKGFLDYHGCGLTNWRILGQVTGRVKVNLP